VCAQIQTKERVMKMNQLGKTDLEVSELCLGMSRLMLNFD